MAVAVGAVLGDGRSSVVTVDVGGRVIMAVGGWVAVGAAVSDWRGAAVATTTSAGALIGSLASPDPPLISTSASPAPTRITGVTTTAATITCHLFNASPFGTTNRLDQNRPTI